MFAEDYLTDYAWEQLIDDVERGDVIPIVGGDLVAVAEEGEGFDSWLGTKLAKNLGVELRPLAPPFHVNQVAQAYFINGKNTHTDTLHSIIKTTITKECKFKPSQALVDLARIKPFKLFLTTTYDGFLEAALKDAAGNDSVASISLAKGKWKDSLEDWKTKERTLVYLLGKYLDSPYFAAWDADIIDQLLDLQLLLENGELTWLSQKLKDKKLLLLGMRFGDWLTRFFIHLIRRTAWHNDTNYNYIAEHDILKTETFVLFIQATRGATQFIPGDPKEFVGELYRRWMERAGSTQEIDKSGPASTEAGRARKGSVFLSYAREDKEAAKTLHNRLKEAGCDVWFDERELEGGEAYAKTMEHRIRWDCCAFVSIISKNTEGNPGFFHQERIWGKIRASYYGALGDFYIPVIVDSELSAQDVRREPLPDHFRPNFVTLPDGIPDERFCNRLINLQKQVRSR
jgi:hypothetical protein